MRVVSPWLACLSLLAACGTPDAGVHADQAHKRAPVAGAMGSHPATSPGTKPAVVQGGTTQSLHGLPALDPISPVLNFAHPLRGSWSANPIPYSGVAIDNGAVRMTVNGTPTAYSGPGGLFSTTVPGVFGLNVLETYAHDKGGHTVRDTRATMHGDQLPYGAPLLDGIVVRLHEGAGGLGVVEDLTEGLVSSADLTALLPTGTPLYNNVSQTCIPNPFGSDICFTWYALTLYVANPTLGGTNVVLDPMANGSIRATFSVLSPSLDWSANAVVAEIGFSGSGDIVASQLTVSVDLTPSVVNGQVQVALSNVSASASNFDFQWTDWLEDALDFFGFNVDQVVENAMVDAIEGAVTDALPGAVGDALQDLALHTGFEIGGVTVDLSAVPGSVSVDDAGLTVALDTLVTSPTYVSDGTGALFGDYAPPAFGAGTGTRIGLSLDFANQLVHTLWGAGLLDIADASALLPIDPAFLFPGATNVTLGVDGALTPAIIPGDDAMLTLQMGSVRATVAGELGGSPTTALEAWASIIGDVDLGTDASGTTLTTQVGDVQAWVDITQSLQGDAPPEAEDAFATLVTSLLPDLTDALDSISIPSVQGYGVTNASVSMGGADGGYILIDGNLAAVP